MIRLQPAVIGFLCLCLMAGDLLGACLAYLLAFVLRVRVPLPLTQGYLPPLRFAEVDHHWVEMLVAQLGVLYFLGLYEPHALTRPRDHAGSLVAAAGLAALLLVAVYFFSQDLNFPRSIFVVFAALNAALLLAWRIGSRSLMGSYPRRRVVVVGTNAAAAARILRDLSEREARAEVARLLERVRLPAGLAERFPGELSGGERQRVAIARALAAQPDLIVCDEITSALDVSVQAAVLELLAELRAELELALLFITHDLGVVASVADRVLVLQDGAVCDSGPVASLLRRPEHEYTRRLVAAAPRLSQLSGAA